MTEAEWLAWTDPQQMLEFLPSRGRASERKLRLFAVACCRLLLGRIRVSQRTEQAIEVAECYADGVASVAELETARYYPTSLAEHACQNATEFPGGVVMADCAALNAAWATAKNEVKPPDDNSLNSAFNALIAAEQAVQCRLLRCIFGNPFRQPFPVARSLLEWTGGLLRHLAQVVYEKRSFPGGTLDEQRLAVLADALEDAGCNDAEILGHCREQGTVHARGCWVIDLLVGRR